jgi:arginine decarboxylase
VTSAERSASPTEKAIDIVGESVALPTNGPPQRGAHGRVGAKKSPKRKSLRRSEIDGVHHVPDVGKDELVGQQHPGDAVPAH